MDEYDTLTSGTRWNEHLTSSSPDPFMSPRGHRYLKRFFDSGQALGVLFVDYIAGHFTPPVARASSCPKASFFKARPAYKALCADAGEPVLVAVISRYPPDASTRIQASDVRPHPRQIAPLRNADSIAFAGIENDGYGLGTQLAARWRTATTAKKELDEYLSAATTATVGRRPRADLRIDCDEGETGSEWRVQFEWGRYRGTPTTLSVRNLFLGDGDLVSR